MIIPVPIFFVIIEAALSITLHHDKFVFRERQQLGFVTLNDNLAVSGWMGLAYDR